MFFLHEQPTHHHKIGTAYVPNEVIRRNSTRQMYEYCVREGLRDAWAYLYRNWYSRVNYNRWAKSAASGMVPMGKTTMMIEAHWKVLKRTHLYHYNRARIDLITFVIIKHYYRKLAHKYQSTVVYRQETSTFEKRFSEDWRKNSCLQVSRAAYATNSQRWVCSCPAFIRSPVCQCKHLVKAYQTTTATVNLTNRAQFIKRSHVQPFIEFLPVKHQNKTSNP